LTFLENKVPKAIEFYKENFTKSYGKVKIPQAIANNLIQAIETMGDDLVLFALQKTLELGCNRDWAYVKSVLGDWYKKGIRTVEQAMKLKKPINKNHKNMTVEEKANSINWDELEG
jgi:DnaD/phage-associated family protein